MKKLIIVAHPNYNTASIINKSIIKNIQAGAKFTDIHIIDEQGNFDIKKEQDLLLKYDIITFAFPLWWYNAPWILQKYLCEILAPGFAYSLSGDKKEFKLAGKKFTYMVTMGGKYEDYEKSNGNLTSVETLLSSLKATFSYISSAWKVTGKTISETDYFLKPIIIYNEDDTQTMIGNAAKKYLKTIDTL